MLCNKSEKREENMMYFSYILNDCLPAKVNVRGKRQL